MTPAQVQEAATLLEHRAKIGRARRFITERRCRVVAIGAEASRESYTDRETVNVDADYGLLALDAACDALTASLASRGVEVEATASDEAAATAAAPAMAITPAGIRTAAALLNELDALRRFRHFLEEHRDTRVQLEVGLVGLACPPVEIDATRALQAIDGSLSDLEAVIRLRGVPLEEAPPQ